MGQITGGHLFFLKRVKTGDYEHEEAQAHINFSVGEGENEAGTLARAHTIALEQVRAILRLQGTTALTPAVQTATSSGEKAKLEAAAKGETKAPKQPPKAKAAEAPKPEEAKPAAELAKPAAAAADDIDDLLGASAPEVTDKQLVEHVTATNQRIKNPAAIKGVTAKYVGGPPKTVRDIPQELRPKFMADLDALQATAA